MVTDIEDVQYVSRKSRREAKKVKGRMQMTGGHYEYANYV